MEYLHLPLSANEFEFTCYIMLNIPCLTIIMPKLLLSCTKMAKRQKIFNNKIYLFNKAVSIYNRITSLTRTNVYMFTYTGFQLFPVSYIFGNLEKTIKYSMHRISKRLKVSFV